MYTLKIQKILNEINRLNIPAEKVKLLKKAIAIADENEDIEWGYDLRLILIDTERDLAFSNESIPAFAWLLQAYEQHPDVFDENDFLWQYKWMMSELYDNPKVSREQIENALEDFKMRLQRNGYGIRAYYNELFNDCIVQKNITALDHAMQEVNKVPRDGMSDCEACEMDAEVTAFLYTRGFDEAYKKALPLLDKQYTCLHVPMRTLVNLCYAAYKNNREEVAASLYPKCQDEIAKLANDTSVLLSAIKLSVYMAAKYPQEAHKWIKKYLPLADGPQNRLLFSFSMYLIEALQLLEDGLIFVVDLPEQHSLYQSHNNQFTKEELLAHYMPLAKNIAQQFDERNSNSNFMRQYQELIS